MRRTVESSFTILVLSLSLTLLTATGCESATTETPVATNDNAGVANHAVEPPSVTADDVEFVDKAGFDQFLAKQEGKVVFVDYWATWCGTCKEQFPHTVELQRKFGNDGLIVVAASVDEPDAEHRQAVAEFLSAQGGDLKAFILQGSADEELFDSFGIEIAVPHYQLFDQHGQLVKKFVFGDPTTPSPKPEDVERAISQLLTGGDTDTD